MFLNEWEIKLQPMKCYEIKLIQCLGEVYSSIGMDLKRKIENQW